MNILIVDDKEENSYLLEVMLKGDGHEVQTSANGAEALEILKSAKIDLIISDILMPVMDGFELCRKLKTDKKLRHIPIIIYTATYTGPKDEEFALKIGADRFIIKPCEPALFMETVHDVLANAGKNDTYLHPETQEEEVLKLYNERLIRKLEQKMLQLEKEIQARRATEEILQQSEEKYKSLYNSIRDAILVTDTNRTIIDCNKAFIDLFGYSLKEIEGKQTLIIYNSEEEFKRLDEELKHHLDDSCFLYTINYKKKDGTIFPGEINFFYLRNDKNDVTGFIGIVRDITERKLAERTEKDLQSQLLHAQKMEAIGLLAGGVAHDFNNLLTVILGNGDILLKNMGKDYPLYGKMEQVYQAGIRAKDLTRQLLAFSRKQVLEMKVIDLNIVVTGFEKLLRRLIGEDIQLNLILYSEPLIVQADVGQLEQVLMNTAVNARDAMPKGGTFTIETTVVESDDSYTEKKPETLISKDAMIVVSDTGLGMDKNILDHLFEPFFTTKSMDKGTGLGLATSYGIIKQHGGNISVYSKPDEGSIFRIYLPLYTKKNDDHTIQSRRPAPPVNGTGTVMIIEDDPLLLNLTHNILSDQGYTVIASKSAADALNKAKEHKGQIHLVLTDVIMPGMKGPEAFDNICKHHPEARVLYMSGYTDNMIESHGVLREGVQFIQKPFTISGLLEKCCQVLHNG